MQSVLRLSTGTVVIEPSSKQKMPDCISKIDSTAGQLWFTAHRRQLVRSDLVFCPNDQLVWLPQDAYVTVLGGWPARRSVAVTAAEIPDVLSHVLLGCEDMSL